MERTKLVMNGIDIDSATLYLDGEVGEAMYRRLVAGMALLSKTPVEQLTIVLNTPGGCYYHALAIYDLIRMSELNVKIVGVGYVMSAGPVIMQAANERVVLPNTQIMLHYGEDENKSPSDLKHNKDLLENMKKIIGEKTKVTKRTLNSWFVKETYFTAKQALKAGLIDRIANDKKD